MFRAKTRSANWLLVQLEEEICFSRLYEGADFLFLDLLPDHRTKTTSDLFTEYGTVITEPHRESMG